MAKPPAKKKVITDPKEARQIYERARQSVVDRVQDPEARKRALIKFDSDPRTQAVRRVAGMPAVTTKQQEIRGQGKKPKWQERTEEIARLAKQADVARARQTKIKEVGRKAAKESKGLNTDFTQAVGAGVRRGLFGVPERLGAAGLYYSGNAGNLTYDETLEAVRAKTDAELEGSTSGNILGQLLGGFGGGGVAANALTRGGAKLAATGLPVVQNIGRGVQGAFQLRRGENARNAGKLAITGGGFGAAQAAGEGNDAAEGAAIGAATGVGLGAAFKGGKFLGGKAAEVLRLKGADSILRKYTGTTREALQTRLNEFRERTGAEPTMYELLDLADRQNLQKVFGRLSRGQQERGAEMARERVESIPGEVAQVVRKATRGQRKQNIETLASAMPESRGAGVGPDTPTPAEARLAIGAADNPTRLAQLRRQEARNIMGPYDDRKAVDEFNELIPTRLEPGKKPGEVVEVPDDPEIASVIRAAAGTARIREKGQGLTIREVTGMIEELMDEATNASRSVIERGVAQRAADYLEEVISAKHPDVAPAFARMKENWAARSRQIEGMLSTRTQADLNPSSPKNLQRSENIYETPEGGVGRAMGQRTELIDDLGAANSPALGKVRQLAESTTEGRRVAQNIGVPATRQITDAARAQSESARRLATAVRDPKFDVSEIESGDLALLAAGLNPSSMAYTKARALTIMLQRFGNSIPEGRSRTIVDMLFSRDPAMTQRAIAALRPQSETGRLALGAIINSASKSFTDQIAGDGAEGEAMPAEASMVEEAEGEPDYSQMSDEELMAALEAEEAEGEPDYSQMSDEELLAALEAEKDMAPFGRRVIEELFPEAEVTDDLRDPTSDLGRKNPNSYHVHTDGAVDIRPIPGMTFDEFVNTLKAEGYNVVEAIDETGKGRSGHATGPHWHVVIG